MGENIIVGKSYEFAISVVRLYSILCTTQHEYVLSKQLLRSGTSIGANVTKAQNAQSKAEFYAKMYIAYKEANESRYWINLLHQTSFLNDEQFCTIDKACHEIVRILAAITKNQRDYSNNQS